MSSNFEYIIHGNDLQMVEVTLPPEQSVIAEVGALTYMEQGVKFETRLGDGSERTESVMGKFFSIGSRILSGENIFVSHFTNNNDSNAKVAFSAPTQGCIIDIKLSKFNNTILCQKDAFLAAERGTHISVAFSKKINFGLFSDVGFIIQKLTGEGTIFLNSSGSVLKKALNDEEVIIETGSLVAFTHGLDYSVSLIKPKNAVFGGEGLFLTTVKGTGTVWIQSHTMTKFVNRISHLLPKGK
jgi:uncharacterized protein (TIGR00266 family)